MSAAQIAEGSPSALEEAFGRLKVAYRTNMYPTYEERQRQLERLEAAVRERKDALAAAVDADYGARSKHETLIAEIYITVEGIRYALKHLKGWMQPQPRGISVTMLPARGLVQVQPKGIVGVIAPWNYPIQLSLLPVAIALAAGNKVMLKPSELTPKTAALLKELLDTALPGAVETVLGGVEVGVAFSKLPFDHLFYTGSTSVGRKVMTAAAQNLTPVTLELGGKSPAILHPDFPLERAAKKILAGKLFNAGQTCIAPDYVLVPKGREAAFAETCQAIVPKMYPSLAKNPDYTSVVNPHHQRRLQGYVDDAVNKGARVVELNPANESFEGAAQKMVPRLLLGVRDDMVVMQDEIFGPILPIVGYEGGVEQAIDYVNDRPRPLALYYFDDDARRIDHMLTHTISGGVCVNDTLLHCAAEDLPFGGVGPSGIGSYHATEGFETMSHKKGVFVQSRFALTHLFLAPFGKTVDRILKLLL